MVTPYYQDDRATVYAGDCLDVLRQLPDNSVDAIVTDPPAGIGFMGKEWDHHKGGRDSWIAWLAERMTEALRVAKPGAHALVWAIPRTSGWTQRALEDAGWDIRDRVTHLFGTGFPKSLDVSKAIDRAAGAEREVVGSKLGQPGYSLAPDQGRGVYSPDGRSSEVECAVTAPATDAAHQWQGWGTALKPAAEDWWLARKPLAGTVAGNVTRWGTGALNIDGCRIGTSKNVPASPRQGQDRIYGRYGAQDGTESGHDPNVGRWPAHVTLDETAAELLDQMSGDVGGASGTRNNKARAADDVFYGQTDRADRITAGFDDEGGASRFFFVAPRDEPCEVHGIKRCTICLQDGSRMMYTAKAGSDERITHNGASHPTVKSLALMRWLTRLITPHGGVVLDCFAGSGATVEAALLEGFRAIGIEREPDYLPLITQRIHRRRNPVAYLTEGGHELGLFDDEGGAA